MSCNRARILTLASNIGINQTQKLADFILRRKRVDVEETMHSHEKRTNLSLMQFYNCDFVKMLRIVLIFYFSFG